MSALTIVLPAWAQSGYPSKPITILVPFPAGGTTDILGRLVGRHLATRLGGTVVVDMLPKTKIEVVVRTRMWRRQSR